MFFLSLLLDFCFIEWAKYALSSTAGLPTLVWIRCSGLFGARFVGRGRGLDDLTDWNVLYLKEVLDFSFLLFPPTLFRIVGLVSCSFCFSNFVLFPSTVEPAFRLGDAAASCSSANGR